MKFRGAVAALATTGVMSIAGAAVVVPGVASAAPLAASCSVTVPNGSSGWCGLIQGAAADSTLYGGQLSLTGDGTMLTIQSQINSSGLAPASSWACLIPTASVTATQDLSGTACASAGGVPITFSGASTVVNISSYTQFYLQSFSVEVGVTTATTGSSQGSCTDDDNGHDGGGSGSWDHGWGNSFFSSWSSDSNHSSDHSGDECDSHDGSSNDQSHGGSCSCGGSSGGGHDNYSFGSTSHSNDHQSGTHDHGYGNDGSGQNGGCGTTGSTTADSFFVFVVNGVVGY